MSQCQAEKICRVLLARGHWSKNSCFLCRRINKETCSVLEEIKAKQEEYEEDKNRDVKDYQPQQNGFMPDRR